MMDQRRERGSEEGEILLVDKPKGWTSFDVVHKVRNVLRMKKAGHAGTLDPLATGLLIVCTGKRTRDIGMFMGLEKEYEAEMCLGGETASFDCETPVVNLKSTEGIAADQIKKVFAEFVGWSTQIPPMWSAAKVRGRRLYAYARRGEDVERKPREVHIRSLEVLAIDVPVVKFRMVCSKGTYVRTLVHDVGSKLGCGAYLTGLVRTKIGDYSLHDAVTIEQLVSAYRMQGIPTAGKLGAS
jgi:tRNA pseudouridine55 synthase